MTRLMQEKAVLTEEQIAAWTEQLESLCTKHTKQDRKDILRLKLSLEEILLKMMDAYGRGTECTFRCTKKFHKLSLALSVPGPELDPLAEQDPEEESGKYHQNILDRLGLGPAYRYIKGVNCVLLDFASRKKMTMLTQVLLALGLSIVTALLLHVLPADLSLSIDTIFINPLFDKLIKVLTTLATPLVFLAVVTGILGLGDVTALGKIGKTFLSQMMSTYVFAAVLTGLVGALIFGVVSGSAGGGDTGALGQTMQLVLDIIPDNLIEPFTTDNQLQVIALAIFLGSVLLMNAGRLPKLCSGLNQLSELVNKMMLVFCKLLPLIVYLGILSIIRSGKLMEAARSYKAVLVFLVTALLVVSFVTLRTCLSVKRPFRQLFRAQLPSMMINLSTSSQLAAMPESTKCCKDRFGIDDRLVDFGLPLGIVLYMPNGAATLAIITWAMAVVDRGGLSPAEIFQLMILAVIIAIAAPPIPGSALIVLPILSSSMQISSDTLPLGLVIITLLGYFLPLLNGYCLQLELLLCGKKLHMLKED